MVIPWKKLDSKLVYENAWLRLREDQVVRPNGLNGIYGVVERRMGVSVVVMTTDRKICLLRLYRYPTQMYSWEIPMGTVDGNEESLSAIQRELKEETGLIAKEWQMINSPMQLANGFSDELMTIFIATDATRGDAHGMIEEGIETVSFFDVQEVIAMIERGEITDAPTLASLVKAFLFLKIM